MNVDGTGGKLKFTNLKESSFRSEKVKQLDDLEVSFKIEVGQ
jgi:hypothetical protein